MTLADIVVILTSVVVGLATRPRSLACFGRQSVFRVELLAVVFRVVSDCKAVVLALRKGRHFEKRARLLIFPSVGWGKAQQTSR
eukprot:1949531-Amphidinium_carterae.1